MSVGSEGSVTADLATSLAGLQFPVFKADVVDQAIIGNAEKGTVELLEKLPDREYQSMDEVADAVAAIPGHT